MPKKSTAIRYQKRNRTPLNHKKNPFINVSSKAVHAYFHKTAQKFAANFKGRNPCSPHSLRAAFRTFPSDHKVNPFI
jgi:hypothetical protein